MHVFRLASSPGDRAGESARSPANGPRDVPPRSLEPTHFMTSTIAPTTPQVAVNDIGTADDFLAAIDKTIKYFNDDDIEALVLQKEDKECRLILSKKRAQYERAWGTIEQKKDNDEVVEGTVIEVVKGGLILDIGLRGFLPASLVEMRRVRDLQPYVGRTLEAKIIELDKNRNNVVLSRRAWLEQTQSEVRSDFLNKLAKGQVRNGVVSSIVNFGAFV